MAFYPVSACGHRLHPLGKDVYVCVSEWNGEPKIHVRAYVKPYKEPVCEAENAAKTTANETGAQDGNREETTQSLYATKRGICLSEDGLEKLIGAYSAIMADVMAVKSNLKVFDTELAVNRKRPQNYSPSVERASKSNEQTPAEKRRILTDRHEASDNMNSFVL